MKQIFVVFLLAVSCMYAQPMRGNQSAKPAVGWDSLKSLMSYPEIARRAGVEATSNVAVKIDSAGNVVDIMISGYNIFDSAIENAVKKVKWQPEMDNNKRRASSVFFDVQFRYKTTTDSQKRTLIIETDKP